MGAMQLDRVTIEANRLTQTEQAQWGIEELIRYALSKRLIGEMDCPYVRNILLDMFQLAEPWAGYEATYSSDVEAADTPHYILNLLLDYGQVIGLIPDHTTTQRDLLDARIMGVLMPRPSETVAAFRRTEQENGIMQATREFYQLSVDSNYIRMDRVQHNDHWLYESKYGIIEMTINVSKPEKSPQEIAEARQTAASHYPQCLLCVDNVGYAGRANHPARQNLRVIPLTLHEEAWHFQYSPYVYYNEHSIVLRHDHVPMKLTKSTFHRLLEFTEQFPHYFIGTNADLPIVGGSILSHDHFQAGQHTFPIERATADRTFVYPQDEDIQVSIVRWPMSVLRVSGQDRERLIEVVYAIFKAWQVYTDPEVGIIAFSDEGDSRIPHNTVTPIVRRRGTAYEVDMVLRNNRTSSEHPEGIFHPHREMHHIKQENVGLIEVMGLAILPARLQQSSMLIATFLTGQQSWEQHKANMQAHDPLAVHRAWIESLIERYGIDNSLENAQRLIKQEIGHTFVEILGQAGVFKRNAEGQAAFERFINHLGRA
ncbi:UDP-glucose--hexose-1-phosphate uridylyltransferase [Paenibacillus sp. UMB4589-SE434]|uniref:UDP-glucose--hexose-1-phosphate uridylyltransferase n=1 Tax=Paenibacillus sp. UMB4589-SE434 TaxID=3046314 RepID=UPI00254BF427|nr:UDP-glucose--hexose-1-phosphate uridylyltransferase [Paenibacillus sp. UMB4589-SE434]MDK8181108.1 UDP-glucose--hexose-1-phosphate uridylyltransferase [Paenibacillus sp. UMB4589-SE434]